MSNEEQESITEEPTVDNAADAIEVADAQVAKKEAKRNPTVVVAEDESVNRMDLVAMLEDNGYEVVGEAANGEEAIELTREKRPDVVCMDVKMPHMDGIELARQISESPILSGIPVILLSGYREFEYAKSAMQYHVQHYILKPVTRQKLEQLEDILTELYKSKEASHQKILALSESNYQKELFDALRHHDISCIEDFFRSPLYHNCMSDPNLCNLMGTRILTTLYDYLGDIHFTEQSLLTSKTHTLETWYSLPNPASKANYLETLYFDILNLLLSQKSNNTSALYRYALQYIDTHYTNPDFSISAMADNMNITHFSNSMPAKT